MTAAEAETVYVYGICPVPEQSLSLPPGLEGETLLVGVDEIAAIVEVGLDLEGLQAHSPRLLSAVLSHDRVLCDLFQKMTILPLRFGTQLPGLDKLIDHLLSQRESYMAKLTDLKHKAEYQIKLIPEDPELSSDAEEDLKGREYFLAKKQRLQDLSTAKEQRQEELQTLLEFIYGTYDDCVAADKEEDEVKIYVLTDRDSVERLTQQVEAWNAPRPPLATGAE
ncbi:MAG: hypothetical protein HC929_02060 [Leptolyngbyaceae cyanobacterium SM2_5_2]|nr:hypothetical protein [Leptolyngbyaceae cyanobacterium SM2_5_2]